MELNFINWLQSFNTPFLDQFFIFVTMLGEEYFYIFALSLFYWCINKEGTRYFVMILTFSAVLNGALKEIVNSARPFQVEAVRALRTETAHGSSFPSGHTQTVTAFYGTLAFKFKNVWLTSLAVIIILLVALSRIYLGVHWPRDVVGGIVLGLLSIAIMHKIVMLEEKKGIAWPFYAVTAVVIASMFFLHSETFIKATGAFLGFMLGYLVEDHYVKFDVRADGLSQIIKFVVGMIFTLAIFEGLKFILPEHNLFTFLRYFTTIFSVVAVIPWIFVKLNLSRRRIFS